MAAGASGVKLVADALSARGSASRARFALFVLEQYLSDWRRRSTKSPAAVIRCYLAARDAQRVPVDDGYACAPTRALGAVDADADEVVWGSRRYPCRCSPARGRMGPAAYPGDKDTPPRRFKDGSVSGTEYTLGPMAGGYLRGDHES